MGGKSGKAIRNGLWNLFWVRLPAYLICAPFIILIVT